MFIILKRRWKAIDGLTKKKVTIPTGRHEIERVKNPFGHDAPWLVLKDTLIGGAEGYWRDWKGRKWDEFEIVIEE